MADLEGIIADAVSDASGSNGDDTSVDLGGSDDVVVADSTLPDDGAAVVEEPKVDDVAEPVVEDKVVVDDKADTRSDAEKILDAAGIKAPKEGERENRIPYSRTVKIVGNALKKQGEAHAAALTTVTAKVAAQDAELVNFRKADSLAVSDPDKYMEILSNINPAFKAFVRSGAAAVAGKTGVAAPASKLGAKPGPDITYKDGSQAFSPEQLEKREEWLVANAVERATADAEARAEAKYGPLAKNFEGTQKEAARHERIQGVIRTEMEHWGDDFPKPGTPEEKAVDTLLKADPKLTLRAAITKVVVGNLKATKQKVREDLLKEINSRKGAAAAAPAARKVAADPNEVKSTEDVIRESIAAAGLK